MYCRETRKCEVKLPPISFPIVVASPRILAVSSSVPFWKTRYGDGGIEALLPQMLCISILSHLFAVQALGWPGKLF